MDRYGNTTMVKAIQYNTFIGQYGVFYLFFRYSKNGIGYFRCNQKVFYQKTTTKVFYQKTTTKVFYQKTTTHSLANLDCIKEPN
jgi:DNA-dependent RNA polymerase auxiliary subunit epsilon